MMTPRSCLRSAFQLFAKQIDEIESNKALINSAIAIAMHSFDDLDSKGIWRKINQLSRKIDSRASEVGLEARIAHLHQVLFYEEGYIAQNKRQASHLLDSFISTVIELKVGSPELIGLIYKVIAKEIGLDTEAVVFEDRLFIRIHDGHGWLLVDLFNQNVKLNIDIIEPIESLPLLTNQEWIRRMLYWNMNLLQNTGRNADYAAMDDLLLLLDSGASMRK